MLLATTTCLVPLTVEVAFPDVELVAAARGAAVGGLQPLNATVASVPNKLAANIIENAENSCLRIAMGSIDLELEGKSVLVGLQTSSSSQIVKRVPRPSHAG